MEATRQLFRQLISPGNIAVTGALIRGEYTKIVAGAEYAGIPLDASLYERMVKHWSLLQATIVDRVNAIIPVYDDRSFRMAKFETWLNRQGLFSSWPRTEGGQIALDDDTFRDQAGLHQELEPLRQVRQMLGQLHHPGLRVGSDGRNRCLLSPFKTKTGRNAPSTAHFIFGLSARIRRDPHFRRLS